MIVEIPLKWLEIPLKWFCTDDLFLMSAQIIPDSPNRQTVTDRILTDDRVEGLRLRRLGINEA